MPQSKEITISGYHGFRNLGDEAILQKIIDEIRGRFEQDKTSITVLSNTPSNTSSRYNVNSINRWNFLKIVRTVGRSELLISGGGGLLQDSTSTISLWYYLAVIASAVVQGTPFFVVGQGIGPIRKRFNRFLSSYFLRRANGCLVRDPQSSETLTSMGISEGKTLVGPDLGLLFSSQGGNGSQPEPEPSQKVIAVAPRDPLKNREQLLEILSEGIAELHHKYGTQAILLSTHPRADKDFLEDLYLSTPTPCRIIDMDHASFTDLITVVGEAELIIGGRLHALEFATVTGTPGVGLSYDKKVDLFVDEVNAGQQKPLIKLWHLEDLPNNRSGFLKDLDLQFSNRSTLKPRLIAKHQELKSKAENQLNSIFSWIEQEISHE